MEVASLYATISLKTDQLQAGLRSAKSQIDGMGNAMSQMEGRSGRAEKSLGGLGKAISIAGAAAIAAKFGQAAYELGMLGAESERAAATFERVAGGSAQAATMLDDLKAATMGTRSELELMNSATTLMALGMGDTSAEIASIMRSVEGLGARFGGTMQTFQLMMSNDSLMRIDSFGIGVEEATERIEEFKAAGMEAGEAFDTAILELMNEKFNQLGGGMEDTVTKTQRLSAAWADLKAAIGSGVAPAIGEVSGALADIVTSMTETISVTERGEQLFGDDYVQALRGVQRGSAEAGEDLAAMNKVIKAVDDQLAGASDSFNDAGVGIMRMSDGVDMYTKNLHYAQAASFELQEETYSSIDAWNQYSHALELSQKAQDDYMASQINTRITTEETTERVERLQQVMGAGLTTGLEDAQEDLVGLREEAGNLEGAIAELEGLSYRTPAQQQELASLQGQLSDVQGEIDGVIGKAQDMAGAFVLAAVQAQISSDGVWTQAETDLYANLGRQLGMFDEVAARMISLSGTAVEAVNTGAMGAQEAANLVVEGVDKVVTKFTEVGTVGAGSFGEIEQSAGETAASIDNIQAAALNAQAAIDSMHGMSIVIDILLRERRELASEALPEVIEDMWTGNVPGMANGGQFWTNGPTPLVVGEGGEPEFVSVIPRSDMMEGGYGMGSSWSGDLVVNGTTDPQATANAVIRALQDRGLLRGGKFR